MARKAKSISVPASNFVAVVERNDARNLEHGFDAFTHDAKGSYMGTKKGNLGTLVNSYLVNGVDPTKPRISLLKIGEDEALKRMADRAIWDRYDELSKVEEVCKISITVGDKVKQLKAEPSAVLAEHVARYKLNVETREIGRFPEYLVVDGFRRDYVMPYVSVFNDLREENPLGRLDAVFMEFDDDIERRKACARANFGKNEGDKPADVIDMVGSLSSLLIAIEKTGRIPREKDLIGTGANRHNRQRNFELYWWDKALPELTLIKAVLTGELEYSAIVMTAVSKLRKEITGGKKENLWFGGDEFETRLLQRRDEAVEYWKDVVGNRPAKKKAASHTKLDEAVKTNPGPDFVADCFKAARDNNLGAPFTKYGEHTDQLNAVVAATLAGESLSATVFHIEEGSEDIPVTQEIYDALRDELKEARELLEAATA